MDCSGDEQKEMECGIGPPALCKDPGGVTSCLTRVQPPALYEALAGPDMHG